MPVPRKDAELATSDPTTCTTEVEIPVPSGATLPGLLARPAMMRRLLVLAHGAGAGMRHAHMERLASALAATHTATLRFEFPYRLRGRPLPGAMQENIDAAAAAVSAARLLADGAPILAGGHSYGGRAISHAAAEGLLTGVAGLVFFSFPLHPPKSPDARRAVHLPRIDHPMLFLSGTRDALAARELLEAACTSLDAATLVWLEAADHSFAQPRTFSGSDPYRSAAQTLARWADGLLDASSHPGGPSGRQRLRNHPSHLTLPDGRSA